MMRMLSKPHKIDIGSNRDFIALEVVFDEGLTFLELDLIYFDELIHLVYQSTYLKLHKEVQEEPHDFDLRRDYLET